MRLREFLNEIEKYKCLKLNIQFEKIIIITTTIIYQTHVLHLKGTKKLWTLENKNLQIFFKILVSKFLHFVRLKLCRRDEHQNSFCLTRYNREHYIFFLRKVNDLKFERHLH